ncbi:serine/arginine repetitive matrix protein 1-like [Acanthaster planci]|uniref:Serine/arginine repetitive matrix protein 1-like n=1 Tax=Acanthaster planci TaxID=133434 RepID=A0A8B7YC30_ACAPL|nr:serine/arginine repetitive matrix protein 1-like [Acanthaster planci]XP_022090797.1 serine/arginine repetitive matrix protein 1-like [Acanthaster planci]XP_022090798.1 serine/arginine repetitive matrix protein 1-like [Acanthaster planci]
METVDSEKHTGLREDIEHLLEQFLLTQNVRFQMFAEEWRKLNFTFIHFGIEKGQEKKEAMQEAFRITTEYFLPPYDLQWRVGALYILYALYMTQPHVPKFKIRISLDQWKSVASLVDTLQSQGHLDTLYVFHKMTVSKAFMFTAMPKKMIFHASYMEGKSDQNPTERWLERHRHSLMTECFDDNTLELHHGLHEQYQNTKLKLSLHDNTSLMIVRESITEYIVKRFEKLEADFEASHEVNQTSNASDSETEDRSLKISQIKARSYSTVTNETRSRRHRQQTAQSPSIPGPSTAKSKVTKSKGLPGRKGKGRATHQSSNTETSEQDENSDDETWTPHGVKKRKSQPEKNAAMSRRSQLLKSIKKVQAGITRTTEQEIINSEEDGNVEGDLTKAKKGKRHKRKQSSTDTNSDRFKATKSSSAAGGSARGRGRPKKAVTNSKQKQNKSSNRPSEQPSPNSKTPEKEAKCPRKAPQTHSTLSPQGETTKGPPPPESNQKASKEHHMDKQTVRSTDTPKKRRRSISDNSTGQKRDGFQDATPKKRLRSSDKAKDVAACNKELTKEDDIAQQGRVPRKSTKDETNSVPGTPAKKQDSTAVEASVARNSGNEGPSAKGDGILEASSRTPKQDSSPSRGHRVPPQGQGSPHQEGQSSVPKSRCLQSASTRGQSWASKTRGKRPSPVGGHKSAPKDQRSTSKEHGDSPGEQMRSLRSNITLKMRGGGIGAKTRGARQKRL